MPAATTENFEEKKSTPVVSKRVCITKIIDTTVLFRCTMRGNFFVDILQTYFLLIMIDAVKSSETREFSQNLFRPVYNTKLACFKSFRPFLDRL